MAPPAKIQDAAIGSKLFITVQLIDYHPEKTNKPFEKIQKETKSNKQA